MDEKPENVPHTPRPFRQISIGRLVFVILVGAAVAVGFGFGVLPLLTWIRHLATGENLPLTTGVPMSIAASAILGFLVGGGLATLILSGYSRLADKWDRMDRGDKVTLFAAGRVGVLPSTPFLFFAVVGCGAGCFQLDVRTMDRLAPEAGDGVDSRLVRLARAIGADIVTNDFNLNRVAALQEVKVLNINDLALGLRPNVLPSEHLPITVIREGNQAHQGIGYLDDGTMVVVENGKDHIGESLDVIVTQVIQTERGKMIFAEVGEDDETNGHTLAPEGSRKRPAGQGSLGRGGW